MTTSCLQYRFADFVLDEREHRLTRAGNGIYLQPKVFGTLLCLVKDAGHLATKRELLDCVWPEVSVTENVLTRCVRDLRDALGDDPHEPRFIATVPRLGYRFIAPVEVRPASGASDHDTCKDPHGGPRAGEPVAGPGGLAASAGDAGWVGGAFRRLRSRPRRRVVWLAFGLVVLGFAATGGALWRSRPALSLDPRDFVLVTDFDNRTGEAVFDRTLAPAFRVSLEQSTRVNMLPRWRAREVLRRMGQGADGRIDEDTAREICLRERVRGLVAIGIGRAGGRYVLTARLVDPASGQTVRSHVEYADSLERVLPALQVLAASVRQDLGEPLASIRVADRNLPDVTTRSLTALRYFADGSSLWETGEYAAALELYEAAVREDPEFAQAHAALGSAYCSYIFADCMRGRQHWERAFELAGRTTEREAIPIRIGYERDLGHFDTATALYKAYLQSYPDDFRIRYQFASMLMTNNRPADAATHLAEVVRLMPDFSDARINLATCYAMTGQYPKAEAEYRRAFALDPKWMTSSHHNHEYGFLLVRAGDLAGARRVFELALPTDAKLLALRSLGLLDMYEGRFSSARTRLEEAAMMAASAGQCPAEARNRLLLAMAAEGQGRAAEALEELARAAEAAGRSGGNADSWLRVRIGVAQARLRAVGPAAALLEELRRTTDPKSEEARSDMHRLEGEVLLARGRASQALSSFKLADYERHSSFTVEHLARLSRLSRDVDGEIHWYRALLGLKDTSLGFEPQQDWLLAHYWLARALASRGDEADARVALAPLLETWRRADSGSPAVADVRRLGARLGLH